MISMTYGQRCERFDFAGRNFRFAFACFGPRSRRRRSDGDATGREGLRLRGARRLCEGGFWLRKKLRKSAVKSLESFARVNLCARQSRSNLGAKLLLVQIRSGPLPAWLAQVAQWIGFALFKFGVSRGGLEASRLNGMIAHRAHSLCLTISAAPGKGFRHARKRKRQSDRSNDHSIGRSSTGDRLRHLGFLFNSRQSQLVWGRACGRILALFGRRPRLSRRSSGPYSAAWRRGKEALSSA
jgi:hypothetical protein